MEYEIVYIKAKDSYFGGMTRAVAKIKIVGEPKTLCVITQADTSAEDFLNNKDGLLDGFRKHIADNIEQYYLDAIENETKEFDYPIYDPDEEEVEA